MTADRLFRAARISESVSKFSRSTSPADFSSPSSIIYSNIIESCKRLHQKTLPGEIDPEFEAIEPADGCWMSPIMYLETDSCIIITLTHC